jgi:tetratricopeptide (TPR) repeat protein
MANRTQPDRAVVASLFGRALEHHRAGRTEQAERLYAEALALDPGHLEALNNRGAALRRLGRRVEALASYDRALALDPAGAETHYNRGNVLHDLRRYDEALQSYERALAINPNYAEALLNRGNALRDLGRYAEALASYDKVIELRPDVAAAWNCRGIALQRLGRDPEALDSYDRALALDPNFAEAHSNRGYALKALNRHREAIASYRVAQRLDPDNADANWNEALALLSLGDFERGWKQYEWRWKTPDQAPHRRKFEAGLWLGDSDPAGKTILLHAEQGLGDSIQFIRYAPLLARRGATVIAEVQAPFRALAAGVAGVTSAFCRGDALPGFDLHCPILSLPLAFRTTLASIPAEVPYLRVPENRAAHWAGRLPAGRRVGLVWSGAPRHRNDHHRSVGLTRLAPLLDVPGLRFVSLQRDVRPGDAEVIQARPDLVHFGAELRDLADTAALMAGLDLVISVDTAAAHLAGALARPVWVLLPFSADFRWLVGRADSPWYPTARLFRQPRLGDWDSVIEAVRRALTRGG